MLIVMMRLIRRFILLPETHSPCADILVNMSYGTAVLYDEIVIQL